MATAGSFTKYRSWSTVESEDPNDTGRFYIPENGSQKKIKKAYSSWAFSLIVLSLSVVFLIGLLVGFYLKESQEDKCENGKRRDQFDSKKLYNVHENIMYFISNDNVRKITRDLNVLKDRQKEYVEKEFTTYGLDRVEINEYEVVVTYPDPKRPNELVVINSTGQVLSNLTLSLSESAKQVRKIVKNKKDAFTQLEPDVVEGELVYGDYGRRFDLARKTGSLDGKVLLIKHGGNVSVNEKISIASSYGVSGILLYSRDKERIFPEPVSRHGKQKPYPLPVQTIQESTMELLLAYYAVYNRNLTVRLKSNYIQTKQIVRNVVGSITGDLERDRFVMIGATRSPFYPQIGTSYMLELARSFKDMQKLNGWTPRRTVKFYSWEHDGITNLGFNEYKKLQDSLLESTVVGYIDLDLHIDSNIGNSSHWLQVTGNTVFAQVTESIVREIPDPDQTSLDLHDTWDGVLHNVKSHDSGLQKFGVPMFKPVLSSTKNLSQKSDKDHHHMYSLAVARVASLVTLRLLDNEVLPFNMTNFTLTIYKSVVKSMDIIRKAQNSGNIFMTELLLKKIEELKDAGRSFTEYVTELKQSDDTLAARRINDAIMKVQRIFLRSTENSKDSVLHRDITDSLHISELVSIGTVTNDYSHLKIYISSIIHLVEQAILCLQSI